MQAESWETQDQVDACLAEVGVTLDQVRRWRREGLLPDADQVPTAYRGSEVRYAIGTCAQIRAATELFALKNRVSFVGWELWWRGFPVDEKHWRSELIKSAEFADRTLSLVRPLLARGDDDLDQTTLPDQMAEAGHSDIIGSRVRRRLAPTELPTLFRVMLETGIGDFEHFDADIEPHNVHDRDSDRTITAIALGLHNSDRETVLGKSFQFEKALPLTLKDIATGLSRGSLSEIAAGPDGVISAARDDVRNALQIARNLHDGFSWIYGDAVFGLRLANWIAKKRPTQFVLIAILAFCRLRELPDALLTSAEIAELTVQSAVIVNASREFQRLRNTVPEFRGLFSAKRVRAALADKISLEIFRRDCAAARLRWQARLSEEQARAKIADRRMPARA